MPIFQRGSARIYFETAGDAGPWVTLLNGHTRSIRDFALMTRHLAAAGIRVLAVDHRGAGQTESDGDFSLVDMVDDIQGLWDYLSLAKTSLLGISMGGIIAQLLAERNLERVEKLLLVSTAARQQDVKTPADPWGNTLQSVFHRLSFFLSEQFVQSNRLLIESMAKNILKQIESGSFTEKARRQSQALKGAASIQDSRDYSSPTLVIHGDQDRIISVEAAKFLARCYSDAKIIVYEGAGHLLLAEAPKSVYADAAAFILS